MDNGLSNELPAPARIGIGGPVGSGKTALIERLIPALEARGLEVAVVTNDLVTREDALRLQRRAIVLITRSAVAQPRRAVDTP